MAFTLEPLTVIDDTLFDAVWESSIPHMNNGSFDWQLFKDKGYVLNTDEDKKTFIKAILQNYIDNPEIENAYPSIVKNNGYPLVYFVARSSEGSYQIPVFLPRPDENGSKAYLYTADFREVMRGHVVAINNGSTKMDIITSHIETNTIRGYLNNMTLRESADRVDNGLDENIQEAVVTMNIGLT